MPRCRSKKERKTNGLNMQISFGEALFFLRGSIFEYLPFCQQASVCVLPPSFFWSTSSIASGLCLQVDVPWTLSMSGSYPPNVLETTTGYFKICQGNSHFTLPCLFTPHFLHTTIRLLSIQASRPITLFFFCLPGAAFSCRHQSSTYGISIMFHSQST